MEAFCEQLLNIENVYTKMGVRVMLSLIVGRRQRIYYGRFSSMLESEVDLEESAAGGTLSRYSQVLVVRIAYCPAPGST